MKHLSGLEIVCCGFSTAILKHLRRFVQSDWFLPVFISRDKDTAWNVAPRMHLAGLIHYNAGIYFKVEAIAQLLYIIFGQILHI